MVHDGVGAHGPARSAGELVEQGQQLVPHALLCCATPVDIKQVSESSPHTRVPTLGRAERDSPRLTRAEAEEEALFRGKRTHSGLSQIRNPLMHTSSCIINIF